MSGPAIKTIDILLVDDHAMFREGLAHMLAKEPDLKIVGQCASASAAVAMLESVMPTMVLLDVDLGNERALDFVTAAKSKGYAGNIVVVTAGISDQEALQLVQNGVTGIIHKHHPVAVLCSNIRDVASGEVCLEKNYLASLFRSVDRTRTQTRPKLTDRDKIILRSVFQGLSNKAIAARLQISEGAVKASVRQVCEKLGVRTRLQLVKVALEKFRDQL
jgi:two-component system nitrate/nitrite response regulator NarL